MNTLLATIVKIKTGNFAPFGLYMSAAIEDRTQVQQLQYLDEWVQMKSTIERVSYQPAALYWNTQQLQVIVHACIQAGVYTSSVEG